MTQEEKAKRYDETLESIKELYSKGSRVVVSKEEFENIFPELAESEDEDVRQAMINFFKSERTKKGIAVLHFGVNIEKMIAWLEKQGEQKPIDKVESKFHEGDWIIYKNDICQIVKREEGKNKLVTTFGIEKELVNERNLSTARLWTIQDAKDGDVLLSKHNQPFIYNGIFDEENVGAYCGICSSGIDFLEANLPCNWSYKEGVKPTTKEQRDQLEKVMNDAGYKWDAEKRELIKVIKIKNSNSANVVKDYQINDLSKKWTDEDEENFRDIIGAIHRVVYQTYEDEEARINWIKSLKERMI